MLPDQLDHIQHWQVRVRLVEQAQGLAISPESDCQANYELDSYSVCREQLRKRPTSFAGSVKTSELFLLQLRLDLHSNP